MGVLVVLNHTVSHLVEEEGKGGTECGGPKQPSNSHSTGQEDVAEAVEGTIGPVHCDVRWWTRSFFFWGCHDDREFPNGRLLDANLQL